MECSMCNKKASYLVYHYLNNGNIEFVEARCSEHFSLEKTKIKHNRKEIRDMRKGKKPKFIEEKLKK